jgi:hypothetical protein
MTLAVALLLWDNIYAQDFVQFSPSSTYVYMEDHYSNGVHTGISYYTYFKKGKGGFGTVNVSATKSGYYNDTVSTGEMLKVTLEFKTSFCLLRSETIIQSFNWSYYRRVQCKTLFFASTPRGRFNPPGGTSIVLIHVHPLQ